MMIAEKELATVYISIGNSDDRLPQIQWHSFWTGFRKIARGHAAYIHGEWLSIPVSPYQNACICLQITPDAIPDLKEALIALAAEFRQDSIAWARAETEFLAAAPRGNLCK